MIPLSSSPLLLPHAYIAAYAPITDNIRSGSFCILRSPAVKRTGFFSRRLRIGKSAWTPARSSAFGVTAARWARAAERFERHSRGVLLAPRARYAQRRAPTGDERATRARARARRR